MSCSSQESAHDASPPAVYTPLPTPTTESQPVPVPKIEELDDDTEPLANVPLLPPQLNAAGEPAKRGRGRPRKHPVPPAKAIQKVTKGRSKTGCITCRRRKKKCDETKPECKSVQPPPPSARLTRSKATIVSRTLLSARDTPKKPSGSLAGKRPKVWCSPLPSRFAV